MTGTKPGTVWTYGAEWYAERIQKHLELWNWVPAFIKHFGVKSVLEVGGGTAFIMQYGIEKYTGIELNEKLIKEMKSWCTRGEFLLGDFTEMDVTLHAGIYDMLLALGVVEHCDGFDRFFDQAFVVQPKYLIVSFFWGLERPGPFIKKCRSPFGGYYWKNRYTRKSVEDYLQTKGISADRYAIIKLGKLGYVPCGDTVLVVNIRRPEGGFSAAVQSIPRVK